MRRQGERVDVTYILFSSGTFGLTFNTTQRGSCLIVKLDPKIITQSDRLPLKFPVGFWKEEICVFLFLFCLSVQVCLRVCHKPVFSVIDTTESVSRTTLQGSNIVARLLRKKKRSHAPLLCKCLFFRTVSSLSESVCHTPPHEHALLFPSLFCLLCLCLQFFSVPLVLFSDQNNNSQNH